jgi:uncharacterized protein (DUF488 family)
VSSANVPRDHGEIDWSAGSAHVDRHRITIYTVGHSNHELKSFVGLLQAHDIALVADVRSSPYSRFVPQANRESLTRALHAAGIAYRWFGDRLGGMQDGAVADYDLLRANVGFQQGITDLLSLASQQRIAIMCSEGDHRSCHRHKLITPALLDEDVHVLHIQPDQTLVDEDREPRQLALF